jgi:hypothetical protein
VPDNVIEHDRGNAERGHARDGGPAEIVRRPLRETEASLRQADGVRDRMAGQRCVTNA